MQELKLKNVHLTMTSVDLVRGLWPLPMLFARPGVTEKDLWQVFRAWANSEPFVRLVKDKRGIYRVPEPKILAGSNFVDVGFEFDPASRSHHRHGSHRQPDERRGWLSRPVHEPDVRFQGNCRPGFCWVTSNLEKWVISDQIVRD